MFELAQSVWPRFGGDRANRSRVHVPGPHATPRWQKISLARSKVVQKSRNDHSGVIVMPDETLRVCHSGLLSAVKLDGTRIWQISLRKFAGRKSSILSLPTALQSGELFLSLPRALLIVDERGTAREISCDMPCDDSGFSLNLTLSGLPIETSITGEVYILKDTAWHLVGERFGYDIVSPAVYDDDSLAIAGYYGSGFCRVSLNGEIHWSTSFREPDLLPVINQAQVAAVGSLNDKRSAFFSPDGKQIGSYDHAAKFAEYTDGGWIALSKNRLARLMFDGRELWAIEMNSPNNWSFVEQPIVDRDGYIYVRQTYGFFCCDGDGKKVFEVKLSDAMEGFISIIAPGVIAYVQHNELFIGYA